PRAAPPRPRPDTGPLAMCPTPQPCTPGAGKLGSRPPSYSTCHPSLLWRATMPHGEQWARTRVRTSRHVRRGSWDRVLRATALEAVLEVNRRPVTVPRTFLQILPFRPTMWSVVTRLPNAQHPPASWGATYGVCPSCSARAPLGQHPVQLVYPRCNGLLPVRCADSGLCVLVARGL